MNQETNTPIVSQILKYLMYRDDIRTAQLARKIQIPQQTVQRIVSGVTPKPHQRTLESLAEYFQIPVEVLQGEASFPEFEATQKGELAAMPGWSRCPLIAWESVATFQNLSEMDRNQFPTIFTDAQIGPRGFALRMEDSSMSPMFPTGSILFVNPEKSLKDRRYVIVKPKDQPRPMLRWLLIDGAQYYFNALNPDLQPLSMRKMTDGDQIYGIVVQSRYDVAEE